MAWNKILLSDNLTQLDNVKSVTYKETVNASEYLRPGCVSSASIEVEVYNTQANAVSAGDVVYLYYIDKNNTQTLIGKFNCTPTIETKTSYKFTAYDNALKLEADFSQWLRNNQASFPMTMYNLVSAACTVAGVTLGSASWNLSTQNIQAFYADGITCRDILSYAAELACCFVRCHTDGNIYFDWYSSSSNTIAPSTGVNQYAYKMDGLDYANYTTTALARVAVHPSGEDDVAYIYPTAITTGNTLHIKNNLLLTGADASLYNAVAQNVYTVMSALGTYTPMTVNLFTRENPFRAGDIVGVTDSQSVSFASPITGMTVTESSATLESAGRQEYEDTTNTDKALVQLATDIVRINKLKVDWADINTAIINYLTANNVTAQNLTIVDEYGNVLATYDANGIRIGDTNKTHASITSSSFILYDKDEKRYLFLGDLRDPSGYTYWGQVWYGDGSTTTYDLVPSAGDVSSIVVEVNGVVVTSGITKTTSQVIFSTPPSAYDTIDISYSTDQPMYRYDLGTRKSATSIGAWSIASGANSEASGGYSNVSGGLNNSAKANYASVAGGNGNTASGTCASVAGGEGNTANHKSQMVFGEYNVLDSSSAETFQRGNYVEIVGNGTASNARSNARTLDWSGNETLAGGLILGTPLSVANGGTGQTAVTTTSTISDIMASTGSGVTINNANLAVWGKVVQLRVQFKLTTAVSQGSNKVIGAVNAAYKPALASPIQSANGAVFGFLDANNGNIQLYATYDQIAANTNYTMLSTYLMP